MAARSTTRMDLREYKNEPNEYENVKTVISSKSLTSVTPTSPAAATSSPLWTPLMAHLKEFVHDEKHFTARWLITLSYQLQIQTEQAALGIFGILGIYLLMGASNHFVANLLLVGIPILLTYVYPKERPSTNSLLMYWALYCIVTVFDNGFKTTFGGWYFFKVCAAATLFLRPFEYGPKIVDAIRKNYKH